MNKPMRLTSSSFLAYAEAALDNLDDFAKIKEYVGTKEELIFDDALAFLRTFKVTEETFEQTALTDNLKLNDKLKAIEAA